MDDNPRIDELRRRVQMDPASLAFAQLAEEYRRAGDYEEAVRVSRAGLGEHPHYRSARVTLGRALMELGRFEEAQAEFEQVLLTAPDHLGALRSIADLHERHDASSTDLAIPTPAPTSIELAPTEIELAPRKIELAPTEIDPVLAELESWLAAIQADRHERRSAVRRDTPDN